MNTGERPAVQLDDQTRVGLSARYLWALVIICVALGGGVAVAQLRLSTTEERVARVEERQALQTLHSVGVDKDIEHIKKSLDSIDKKLDRMLEQRRVRIADGGP